MNIVQTILVGHILDIRAWVQYSTKSGQNSKKMANFHQKKKIRDFWVVSVFDSCNIGLEYALSSIQIFWIMHNLISNIHKQQQNAKMFFAISFPLIIYPSLFESFFLKIPQKLALLPDSYKFHQTWDWKCLTLKIKDTLYWELHTSVISPGNIWPSYATITQSPPEKAVLLLRANIYHYENIAWSSK